MKRRNFLLNSLKTLLGLSVLPNMVKSEQIAESFAKTREVVAVNLPPRNPERATKYISGLYRKSYTSLIGVEQWISGVDKTSWQDIANDYKFQPYVISGEGKTREEAWERFWEDFNSRNYGFIAKGNYKKDIFWRRVVEEGGITDFGQQLGTIYVVNCRFSLGDFT